MAASCESHDLAMRQPDRAYYTAAQTTQKYSYNAEEISSQRPGSIRDRDLWIEKIGERTDVN